MTVTAETVYRPIRELLPSAWPWPGLVPDDLDVLWVGDVDYDAASQIASAKLLVDAPLELRLPGLDFLTLAVSPASGGTAFQTTATLSPFTVTIKDVPIVARIDASILRPVIAGSREVDSTRTHTEVQLGSVTISLNEDGDVGLAAAGGPVNLPRCMIGATGFIVEASGVQWLDPTAPAPTGSAPPPGFTGLYIGGAGLDVPGIDPPTGGSPVVLEHLFVGTGGVSGPASLAFASAWDGSAFTGPLSTTLFGFSGGLAQLDITLQQGALTSCEVRGNVYVPYLEKVIGLELGFDGAGGLTAVAGPATCTLPSADAGASAGPDGYLATVDAWEILTLDLRSVAFGAPGGAPAYVELSGRIALSVPQLDMPPVELTGLRIDTTGKVVIDGGWIDLSTARLAPFNGFPLEITKIGFGADETGRRWIGLNGGVKLADGLPLGAAVEGLRIFYDPVTNAIDVTLDGVEIAVTVPGAFSFVGYVAFFSDANGSGFRGNVVLTLTSLGMTVDASIVIGRTPSGSTFFYLYLGVDLPAGIPLFQTGAAFYGFAGLVAVGMAPDRQGDESWYYGWYSREPKGVTDSRKWRPKDDAFAVGAGTTIGTVADNGFSFNTKVLLILLLPGPQLLLQGKASFLKPRPGSQDPAAEGTLEALLVLDVPAKLFQANLAATYRVPHLLTIEGGADVAFSWAPSPPADVWHVYVGEKTPVDRRLKASVLQVLDANAYFMLNRSGILMGAWAGVEKKYKFGP
ncbi:MAG: hypothetical protein M3P34_11460, partial [Actinomycetota bacterium]|nr:hypothetical protein [Actinomycetota bacterium]